MASKKIAKKTTGAKKAKASTKTFDEPMAPKLAKELALQTDKGRKLLFPKAKKAPTPKAIAAAITEYVDAIHAGKKKLSSKAFADQALMLACAWGTAVCDELGYEWVNVRWPDGNSIGIVPKKRQFAIYPLPYVRRIMDDRDADNTILLLFNMLVAGNVPKSAPNAYVTLG
jgi:hypothetical protein